MLGIQPTGEITMLLDGRAAFQSALANPQGGITDLGNDRYRLIDLDHPYRLVRADVRHRHAGRSTPR